MSISTQAHDNFSLWPMWHFSRRRALLQSYMHSQCLMWYLWFSYSVQSRKYCRNDHACTSSEYQAVSLLPHGLGTRIAVIQLFRSVSSCPYSKDGRFVDTNLQQFEGLVPCEWAHNHGANLQSVSERLLWFCVLWRFTTFSLSVLLFLRLLDIVRHLHS